MRSVIRDPHPPMAPLRTTRAERGEERLPLTPFLARFGMCSADALAARMGVDRASIQRWKRDGIPWSRADQLAVASGLHPAEVWAEW